MYGDVRPARMHLAILHNPAAASMFGLLSKEIDHEATGLEAHAENRASL
jgi:hypothetical protein